MRQEPAAELPFISFTEYSDSTHILIDATDLEAYSTHTVYLESFDALSLDKPTLRVDQFDILIGAKACDVF